VIREGKMNVLLLRPISPIYDAIATEVAGKVVTMAFVVPLTGILAFVLRPEYHVTAENGLAFIPALALAWALCFFWGYWLALLAFWATRADALLAVQDSLIFLLAGQVTPTVLLPGVMRKMATVLPFRYMVGFPVEVLTGQLDGTELWAGFAFQIGWLSVALVLFVTMWRTGVKRYAAVGG
jgi:ABC-2 type transport system permease protein